MNTKNKIPFDQVDQSILQDVAGNLVKNHVYVCQSHLVSELMDKEIITIDDYINLIYSYDEIKSVYGVKTDDEVEDIRDNGEDIKEVYEHWLCSSWLIDRLKEINEPILETDLETWWGRTTTGQAILLDYNIQKLAYDYSYDQRLFNKKVA